MQEVSTKALSTKAKGDAKTLMKEKSQGIEELFILYQLFNIAQMNGRSVGRRKFTSYKGLSHSMCIMGCLF